MNSIMKKTTAYFLIFMLIFGMSMSSFAITNPYLTLGNDNGAATVFSYYKDGDVFLDLTGSLYATFEGGNLKVTNAPDLAAKISVDDKGTLADWTSTFPIGYVYLKTGTITDLSPIELQTNKPAGNSGGLLYEYPANTKSGQVTTPDAKKGISHLVFFFQRPEPAGKIIVTKDVTGDTPKTPGEFKFYLIKKGNPDTQYANFTITGENSFTLENVPFGNYALQEYSYPAGYTPQTTAEIPIVVSSSTEPYRVTFTNSYAEEKISVGVTKIITGDNIPNPKEQYAFNFELVNKDTGLVVKTLTINGEKTAYFEAVPLGTYFIREVNLPKGFELTTSNNVEIVLTSGSQPNPISFTNNYNPDKYKINVTKGLTGDPFFNAMTFTFELYRDGGDNPDVLVDTIHIIGAGTGTFKLVDAGNYYVKETPDSNDKFILTSPNDVPVIFEGENKEATVSFSNHHITYLLGVQKELTETSDTPINPTQEFTFNLYKQSDLNIIIDTVKVPIGGHAIFKPLEAGTYVVREVPVAGFDTVADQTVTFPLPPTPPMEPTALSTMANDSEVTARPVHRLIFFNNFTRYYDIYVTKDILSLAEGAPSSVFTFALYNADAPNTEIDRVTVIGEDTGHFKPVREGTYIIREINIPSSYEQVAFSEGDDAVKIYHKEVSVNPEEQRVDVTFTNKYIQMFDIKVNKTLSGGSQNAVFTFRLYKVGSTEYEQQLQITGTGSDYFAPVPAGEYYVKEVNIPNGYVLRSNNDQPAVVNVQKPEAGVSFRNEYIEESTEPTTAPPTTEPTTAPPTTQPTTAPSTETLTEEFVPEGFNFDIIYDVPEEITEEETPLGTALPQTGQLPASLFYGFGGLISTLGVYLKKRK